MENNLRLLTSIYSYAVLFSIVYLVSMWRIYKKAGQPGWATIVPFYNIIVLLRIISKPSWWLILLIIPGINIVIYVWMVNLLAKKFERNIGFTFGLIFLGLIFYPLLAFKEYMYKGNLELQPKLFDDSEEKRDKLLIWFIVVSCIGQLFWVIFTISIKEWWNYYYINIPIGALLLLPFFLIGISVGNRQKTVGIVLSICFIIIASITNLMILIKEFIQNNSYVGT